MILADTSAWIEYDRATGSLVDERIAALIEDDGWLCATEPVLMEMLAGTTSDRHADDIRRLLLRKPLLTLDAGTDFESAASIYRRCRRSGVTPRGMIDCLIAAVAWRHGATLLSHDADLARVADVLGIAADPASLRVDG